jgi:hypothetical protein
MRIRLWTVPFTIIVVLIIAGVSRWDLIDQEDNKIYYTDRWLGQTWVLDRSNSPWFGYPLIAAEDIDAGALAAINADPSLAAAFQALEQAIAEQTTIRNANEHYAQEYTEILSQQSNDDVLQLLNGNTNGEEIFIPEEIQAGDYLYEQSSYQLVSLSEQKADLWHSTTSAAEKSLYEQAVRERKIVSNILIAVGSVAFVWMLYLLSIGRNKPADSYSGQTISDGS